MSDDPILAALARLEAGQAELQAGQTELRTGLADVRTELTDGLADLKSGQQNLHAVIRTLRMDFLSELGGRTVAITEKIAELKGEVTAIRDDIAVNMGAADAMQKANDNTRELVRLLGEQFSIMWKQLKQVQQDIRDLKGSP